MQTVVSTVSGRVEGSLLPGGIVAYRGISYAATTAGEGRWRAPQPPEPWTEVRPAVDFGPIAPQPASPLGFADAADRASEDCLTLNIWTPALDGSRPVMVWFHGGGFTSGGGSIPWYSGTRLAARGVVVVTVNYRLGALGFCDLSEFGGEDFGDSANVGLLDQQAALRWVRDNITGFGGDATQVTMWGESAGAMSASVQLVMPGSEGLFARVIAQSGALHYTRSREASHEVAARMIAQVGVGVDRLREVPVARIIEAQAAVGAELTADPLPFMPTTDGRIVPEDPYRRLASGVSAGIPVINGTTRDEMQLFTVADPAVAALTAGRLSRRLARVLAARGLEARPEDVVDLYRERLGAEATPGAVWSAAMTDAEFRIPSIELLEAQSPHAPVYHYVFAWPSPAFGGALGSCHALDVPFVFDNLTKPGVAMLAGDEPPAPLATTMADAWVAFASTGTPGQVGRTEWQPYEPTHRMTAWFDSESSVVADPLSAERRFWTGRAPG